MALVFDLERQLGPLSLKVAGEIGTGVTALFGPSGAGKSSLVALLAGLMQPDRGSIALEGKILVDVGQRRYLPPHRREIGCVFQDGRLFPHLTVQQNLSFGPFVRRLRLDEITRRELIDRLALSHLLERRPARLSGGEKQRVAIARAILAKPRLLLMDEPMASLDEARKEEILPYLEDLPKFAGVPILYVSHSVTEVLRLADQVIRMDEGRITAVGSPQAILSAHSPADTAQLSYRDSADAGAVITAVVAQHDLEAQATYLQHPGGSLTVPYIDRPLGAEAAMWIASRDVALAVGDVGRISIRNRLLGHILAIHDVGTSDVDVEVAVGAQKLRARITKAARQDLGLEVGADVTALVKAVAIKPVFRST